MHNLTHFVVTGCSFSAGVFDEVVPAAEWVNRASSWPMFLYSELMPVNDTFINLAIPGGGNTAAFTNLIYLLESNKNLTSKNTIIGFNVTSLYRQDQICDIRDTTRHTYISFSDVHKELKISWKKLPTDAATDFSTIAIQSALKVIESITYLEQMGYNYFFMLMNDDIYYHSPEWFQDFLDKRKDKTWITFGDCLSMDSFTKSVSGYVSDHDLHPNLDTHKLISQRVKHFLNHIT